MRDHAPRSLRRRLTASFAVLLLVGLLLFAAAAVWVMDRNLRATLDSRLAIAANAAATFLDVSHGRIKIDSDDREQFLSIMGVDTGGLVTDTARHVLFSSAARAPQEILSLAGGTRPHFATVGKGDASVRAFALPVSHAGIPLGTVIAWRSSDWIDETDRTAAIAFAAAALLIAALAVAAGNLVARRALEDAFARQRRFTADASHELRAPLAVIRAEADLALRKTRDADTYRSALHAIAAEADRIEALIGHLLSAARAESGHLRSEAVDAAALARAVCARLQPVAAAKNVSLAAHAQGEAFVAADRSALEGALLAVAHNAVIHAAHPGAVSVTARRSDGVVEIVVQDDGGGFSDEALAHGTERFWRDERARTHGGSGLGLAIARSVMESFHGNIALANEGRGACVTIRIPALRR